MATLDPHQGGDVSARHRRPNVGGRGGQLDIAVGVREGAHGPDQVQGALKRGAPGIARVHPDREERGGEPPFAHARDVDVPVGQPGADIGLHVEHALGRVDVAVHDDGLLEHEQQS